MSDYFDEESPWSRPLADTGFSAFETPVDDVASPWGNSLDTRPSDDEDAKSKESVEEANPYESTPYGNADAPLVADDTEFGKPLNDSSDGLVSDVSLSTNKAADSNDRSEPVPELKPVERKTRANKKKRAGAGAVKVESVASDPLAASSIQFDKVALTSDSVANLDINKDSGHERESLYSSAEPSNIAWSRTDVTAETGSDVSTRASSRAINNQKSLFEINVGDPSTVGDLTNTHTEYTIQMTTTSDFYEIKEAAVQRRYRDFRWLYRTLEHNHPGVAVPPPPEKQALGRFNEDFVQQRRAALEQMLRKITVHSLLKDDADLKAFLTSPDFGEYLKSRLMGDEELEHATRNALNQTDSGRNSGWGYDSSSGGGSGFIGSLSGALSLSRGGELDPWTIEKRSHLDHVESQLRQVCKELVQISLHRQQLSDALADFANVARVLSDIEATRKLSTVLRSFAKVHDRLGQIYVRQRQQNLLTLEFTLDEHLRTVGSIRDALAARQKVFSAAEHAGSEVEKRQLALDKIMRQNKTQEDRQKALEEEIEQLTETAAKLHHQAADIAHLVESEINRVNDEKIEEFRNSVEVYLENTVEAQKESIEIWETFYTQNFALPPS